MSFLSPELLSDLHDRAHDYDLANAFPEQDLSDLTQAGYLSAFVPAHYGGAGLSLREIAAQQCALAKAAPATALGINMHQIIVGLGRTMVTKGHKLGDEQLVSRGEEILIQAVNNEVFGFGISEPSNDLVLFGSITQAEPIETKSDTADTSQNIAQPAEFSFTGTKIFTSLAPAWTRLATFGRWDSPAGPKSVFAVLKRTDGGFQVKDDWDTVGMRATQSNTTVLTGARSQQILAIVDPGPSAHPVVFGIFANFEVLLAATYTGIGLRAIEVAAQHVKNRQSVKNQNTYANDPDIRWRLAEAAITMDAITPQIEAIAQDLDDDVDRGAIWMPQLSALKNRAVEASRISVEQCIRACGGSSYYSGHELSRLYRDVLAGIFQPSDQESLHGAWANVVLGPVTK